VAAGWDVDRYQRQFGFVSALGGDVLELLDPVPGETVLDLGCGTGGGGGGAPSPTNQRVAA
jgi:predicted RNA methylase